MARLPADACPYPRPFPDGFAECPLYDGERYVPADSKESPLGPIWICRHLVTRPFNLDGVEHHYGACRLEAAEPDVAWWWLPGSSVSSGHHSDESSRVLLD